MTEGEKVSRSPIVVADPSDPRFAVFVPDVLEELFEFGDDENWQREACFICWPIEF